MEERDGFYKKVVGELIPSKKDSVLICGAGSSDKNVFEDFKIDVKFSYAKTILYISNIICF